MKLLKQLVERRLNEFEEKSINNKYDYFSFYQAYNLACVVMNHPIDVRKAHFKNKIYIDLISGRNVERNQAIFNHFMKKDRVIINLFLEKFKDVDVKETFYGSLVDETAVGILSYEFEE